MKVLLAGLLRFVYHRLLPAGARSTLRLRLLLELQDRPPRRIERLDAGSVLVLAPHMDDETIGCGGTIRRHVLAGSRVTVMFLTDGSQGDRDLVERRARGEITDAKAVCAERALVVRRKEEARRAADVLGIGELVFLDEPDSRLSANERVVGRVLDWIGRNRPEVVYLPSTLDPHEDHWATNLVFEAVAAAPACPADWSPVVREYEVWAPLVANAQVDIGEVQATKEQALAQYESQLRDVDYVRVARAMNAYRSIHHLAGRGYAEVFFEGTLSTHRLIMGKSRDRR